MGRRGTGGAGDRDRTRRRLRLQGWLAAVAGVAALVAGAVVLVAVPGAVADERAFVSAHHCEGPDVVPGEECVRSVWLTVDDVHVQRGRSSKGWVEGSADGGWRGRADFEGVRPFLSEVRPGDRVAATLWRGDPVLLWQGSDRQSTSRHPAGTPVVLTAIVLVLALAGAVALHAAWWWLRRTERCLGRTPPALTAVTGAGLLVGLATFPLMAVLGSRAGGLDALLLLWSELTAVAFLLAAAFVRMRGRG